MLRNTGPGIGYVAGRVYEVTEAEYERLKKVKVYPRIADPKKREAAGIPLNIQVID